MCSKILNLRLKGDRVHNFQISEVKKWNEKGKKSPENKRKKEAQ